MVGFTEDCLVCVQLIGQAVGSDRAEHSDRTDRSSRRSSQRSTVTVNEFALRVLSAAEVAAELERLHEQSDGTETESTQKRIKR